MSGDTENFGTLKPGAVQRVAPPSSGTGKRTDVMPRPAVKAQAAPPPRPQGPPVSPMWERLRKRVKEVCPYATVGPRARWRFREKMSVLTFLDALVGEGLFTDAVRVLAAALPKREAVWWACHCLRETKPTVPSDCLRAAEAWVKDPTEENRRAAEAAAAAGTDDPARSVALAAFWSGGSMAPADAPVIPPAENFTPDAVSQAIVYAAYAAAGGAAPTSGKQRTEEEELNALLSPPYRMDEQLARLLEEGLEVARGTRRWPEPRPAASAAR